MSDPEQTAYWADWPVNENDLHARHLWLVNQLDDFVPKLEADPDYYDPKIAGWWVWCICAWIGGGWCFGKGPWRSVEGKLVKVEKNEKNGKPSGINRNLPHLGDAGSGINRKRPHLGSAGGGINRKYQEIYEYFQQLADRLRNVRICCGDWRRILGPTPTFKNGLTGIVLDPPYDHSLRDSNLYRLEGASISSEVREWAITNGDNPLLRIALCGYAEEHIMPKNWECVPWTANGGYGLQGNGRGRENRHKETIWFSPHCLRPDQGKIQLSFDLEGLIIK